MTCFPLDVSRPRTKSKLDQAREVSARHVLYTSGCQTPHFAPAAPPPVTSNLQVLRDYEKGLFAIGNISSGTFLVLLNYYWSLRSYYALGQAIEQASKQASKNVHASGIAGVIGVTLTVKQRVGGRPAFQHPPWAAAASSTWRHQDWRRPAEYPERNHSFRVLLVPVLSFSVRLSLSQPPPSLRSFSHFLPLFVYRPLPSGYLWLGCCCFFLYRFLSPVPPFIPQLYFFQEKGVSPTSSFYRASSSTFDTRGGRKVEVRNLDSHRLFVSSVDNRKTNKQRDKNFTGERTVKKDKGRRRKHWEGQNIEENKRKEKKEEEGKTKFAFRMELFLRVAVATCVAVMVSKEGRSNIVTVCGEGEGRRKLDFLTQHLYKTTTCQIIMYL